MFECHFEKKANGKLPHWYFSILFMYEQSSPKKCKDTHEVPLPLSKCHQAFS